MTHRILLLGGTTEALGIARTLSAPHIYSLAGLGKTPQDLACQVRVGGYGGATGLANFMVQEGITLLLDVTHPYAAQISHNAAYASQITGVPCWALRRDEWQVQAGDQWQFVDNWESLTHALQPFRRPFFTSGREPLAHLDDIPAHQYWIVRCLDTQPALANATIIGARGPFTLEGERALFSEHDVDVLISKNSGSVATEPKLQVARERQIPVLIMKRPVLPAVTREFTSINALQATLQSALLSVLQ